MVFYIFFLVGRKNGKIMRNPAAIKIVPKIRKTIFSSPENPHPQNDVHYDKGFFLNDMTKNPTNMIINSNYNAENGFNYL